MIFKKLITRKIWNLYDALEGEWFSTSEKEPELEEIKITHFLQPRIKDVKIKKSVLETLKKLSQVVTPRAITRYSGQLRKLGIPTPVTSISFDKVTEIYYPFYLGFLKRGEKERIIGIDGVTGEINITISEVLTKNLSYVLSSLEK